LIQQTIEKVLISGLKSLTIINKAASSAGLELGFLKVNYTAIPQAFRFMLSKE